MPHPVRTVFVQPTLGRRRLTTPPSSETPTVPGVDRLRTDLSETGPASGLGALQARLAHAVVADPATLPAALAALLDAEIATDTKRIDLPPRHDPGHSLRIPSPWNAPLILQRPGRPFTPTEAARARRLARCCRVAVDARDDGDQRPDQHRSAP